MKVYQPLLYIDWNLLFSAITVLVLFLILKHFLFEKVHDFMIAREEEVEAAFQRAEEVNRQADEKLEQYETTLAGVNEDGRKIMKAARDEAKRQAESIVDAATQQAHDLIDHAQKEIRREKYNARKELQEEIGNMAMMAAEQILQRELTTDAQHEIVNNIIKEAEEKPWN